VVRKRPGAGTIRTKNRSSINGYDLPAGTVFDSMVARPKRSSRVFGTSSRVAANRTVRYCIRARARDRKTVENGNVFPFAVDDEILEGPVRPELTNAVTIGPESGAVVSRDTANRKPSRQLRDASAVSCLRTFVHVVVYIYKARSYLFAI